MEKFIKSIEKNQKNIRNFNKKMISITNRKAKIKKNFMTN